MVTKYVFAGSQRIASIKPGLGGGASLPTRKRWLAKAWERVVEFFGGSVAEASGNSGATILFLQKRLRAGEGG